MDILMYIIYNFVLKENQLNLLCPRDVGMKVKSPVVVNVTYICLYLLKENKTRKTNL